MVITLNPHGIAYKCSFRYILITFGRLFLNFLDVCLCMFTYLTPSKMDIIIELRINTVIGGDDTVALCRDSIASVSVMFTCWSNDYNIPVYLLTPPAV